MLIARMSERVRPFHWALWAVPALVGCAQGGSSEPTRTTSQALTLSQTAILGFESTAAWSASGFTLSANSAHTQGSFSLAVKAHGYVPLVSAPLPGPVTIGATVSVDLQLPTTAANPAWLGALQLYVSSPSSNVFNAYIGQRELTGFPAGAFQTVSFRVPSGLAASIKPQANDVSITLALNVPSNDTGTYLLDNLMLTPALATCSANTVGAHCDDGNPCTSGDTCTATACVGSAVPGCAIDATTQAPALTWSRPLELDAFRPACTGSRESLSVPATVPLTIPAGVSMSGTAATTLSLSYARPQGGSVVCTYSAAAASSTAQRQAAFVSCSDGSTPGHGVNAENISLQITSATGVPATGDGVCAHSAVSAKLPLPSKALPELPEPLSAAQTQTLRQSFSWANTQAVAELDAKGRPNLYYALVYIESRDQLGFLDQLQIHHDFLPIFEGLDRWRGLTGVFTHHGDGTGVYTFAVMTGSQYNFIRQAALSGKVAFNAINFRAIPAAFLNPDGVTLAYQALANIGFRYRGLDPATARQQAPLAPVLCSIDFDGGVRDVIQEGASIYHDVGNAVESFIGDLWGDVVSTEHIGVHLHLLNTDPTFNTPDPASAASGVVRSVNGSETPILQAWGAEAKTPIVPAGMTLELRGVHVPQYSTATLDATGFAGPLTAVAGTDVGLCLLPKNDAANIIDFITTAEMCDFGPYSFSDSTPPQKKALDLKLVDDYTNVFAQMTDGRNFSRSVVGLSPSAADVLVGHYANMLPNPITPCFTRANPAASTMATLLSAFAALENPSDAAALVSLGSCIFETDMVVPSESGYARSRGVASHEYGHWALCNMLSSGDLASAYNAAILETVSPVPPVEVLGECDQACGNEGFADFYADQLVGGANEFEYNGMIDDVSGYQLDLSSPTGFGTGVLMSYCPSTAVDCFDDSVGGQGQASAHQDPRHTDRARMTSTLHDFVDGHVDVFQNDTATNGNYWENTNPGGLSTLVSDPRDSGQFGDEQVQLPGSAIADGIRNRRGISLDQDAIFGGMADAAYAHGSNWCDLCRLFATHQPNNPCVENAADPDCRTHGTDALYASCTLGNIAKWIGPEPSPTDPSSCTFKPVTGCPSGQVLSCCAAGGVASCGTDTCCASGSSCIATTPGFAACCDDGLVQNGECCSSGKCTTDADCPGTNTCDAAGCCRIG